MDPATATTIEKIQNQIVVLEEEIFNHKSMINTLCALEKEPPMFPELQRGKTTSAPLSFRSDQFFGKPLATAVKDILEQRAARSLGAISLDELFDTMKAGGFEFD